MITTRTVLRARLTVDLRPLFMWRSGCCFYPKRHTRTSTCVFHSRYGLPAAFPGGHHTQGPFSWFNEGVSVKSALTSLVHAANFIYIKIIHFQSLKKKTMTKFTNHPPHPPPESCCEWRLVRLYRCEDIKPQRKIIGPSLCRQQCP